jgi:hypothetical protein
MKHNGIYKINKRIKSSLAVFELSDGVTIHFVVLKTSKSFGKYLCEEHVVGFSD